MPQHSSSGVSVEYNKIRFKCLRKRLEPNYDNSEKADTIQSYLNSARKDRKSFSLPTFSFKEGFKCFISDVSLFLQ